MEIEKNVIGRWPGIENINLDLLKVVFYYQIQMEKSLTKTMRKGGRRKEASLASNDFKKEKSEKKTSQFLVKNLVDEQRLFFVGSILSIHSWVTRLISEQADLHLQYFNLDLPKVLLKRSYREKKNR